MDSRILSRWYLSYPKEDLKVIALFGFYFLLCLLFENHMSHRGPGVLNMEFSWAQENASGLSDLKLSVNEQKANPLEDPGFIYYLFVIIAGDTGW